MKRRMMGILLAACMLLSCLAAGGAMAEETNSTDKLLVYLSGPAAMLTALEEGFEEDRGDVADFLIMSCGEVRSKVWTEKEAGAIQADVIWGSDPLIYNMLDEEGLLCDVSGISNAAAIADEFATDHNYLLVNERYIAIIYNTEAVTGDAVPAGLDDLLDAQYQGGLVMADATQSSTALGIASCLYQLKGAKYLEGLKANGTMLCKSNGQVPSLILEGQYDIGIAPHDAVIRLRNKAKKEGYELALNIAWPSEGAIAIRRPVAIIQDDARGQEQQSLAEELVNYLLSKKAQAITAKFGFVSVRSDMENAVLPDGVEKVVIDWEEASDTQDELKTLYEQIFQN